MKPRELIRFLFLAFIFSAAAQLGAQPAPVSPAQAPVRIRLLGVADMPSGILRASGKDFVPLKVPYLSIGAPFDQAAGEFFELNKLQADAQNPAAQPKVVRIGRVPLPSRPGQVLVVLWPSPADKDGELVHGRAYEEGSAGFPEDTIKVINLSPVPVAAVIGAEEAVMAPFDARLFKPEWNRQRKLRTQAAAQIKGDWVPFQNGFTSLQAGARLYCLAIYDPRGLAHLYSSVGLAQQGGKLPPTFFWMQSEELPPPTATLGNRGG